MILAIRTDNPRAEIGLFEEDGTQITYEKWQADRQLSASIHLKIEELLQGWSWQEISGVVFYAGPGSFTGLRIGASVANALASQLDIPITQSSGQGWIKQALIQLKNGPNNRLVVPRYGGEVHITKPKK